ncbi:MAG TPA: hypothetical protein VJT15_13525 [Pyrinomonadaceae bacterium]|nr:hypothetical protein [Pyrinomonadaceae bacterium]
MELTATGEVQRPWQPVAGFTWELFLIGSAWVIAFATIPFVLFWMKQGASPSTLFWCAFWGYMVLTYIGTSRLSDKYRERQRKILLSAEELLKRDTRPHVLYLRSFKDDETTSRLLNLSSEEQELALTLFEIGPFIAFGEPGEESPDPGAARMYVGHEHWQQKMEGLMTNAQLVVGRIANSESFWWEMRTARKILSPERLLLLLPEDGREYRKFKQQADGVFPRLPEHKFQPKGARKSHISTEGLIYFESDWTPRLKRLKPARLRQNYWAPGVPIMKMALQPVFKQLGIAWRRPPLQPLAILAVVLLLLFIALALYVGALQIVQFIRLFR